MTFGTESNINLTYGRQTSLISWWRTQWQWQDGRRWHISIRRKTAPGHSLADRLGEGRPLIPHRQVYKIRRDCIRGAEIKAP
eukprot:2652998-Ditylum_brightwellii.AAC.1